MEDVILCLGSNASRGREFSRRSRAAGFTLIELLLAIAVIALLAGFILPLGPIFQSHNELDLAANALRHSLRRAQVLAEAMDGDMSWGVLFKTGRITLFKGVSSASRDSSFDETFDISEAIAISGPGEIVFSKFGGTPLVTGTIVLSTVNASRAITINEKGTIIY